MHFFAVLHLEWAIIDVDGAALDQHVGAAVGARDPFFLSAHTDRGGLDTNDVAIQNQATCRLFDDGARATLAEPGRHRDVVALVEAQTGIVELHVLERLRRTTRGCGQ